MRFLAILCVIAALLLIGTFAFFGLTDISTTQQSISVDISEKVFHG